MRSVEKQGAATGFRKWRKVAGSPGGTVEKTENRDTSKRKGVLRRRMIGRYGRFLRNDRGGGKRQKHVYNLRLRMRDVRGIRH